MRFTHPKPGQDGKHRHRCIRPLKACIVNQNTRAEWPNEIRNSRPNRQPTKYLLHLRHVLRRTSDVALQCNDRCTRSTTSHQSTKTQYRKARPNSCTCCANTRRQYAPCNRFFKPMRIGITPCRQGQKNLCQSKQGQKKTDRRSALASTQSHQRCCHAHTRHTGMQADLACNQSKEFAIQTVVSALSVSSKGSSTRGKNFCDSPSGKASTFFKARRICRLRVSALSKVSAAFCTCSRTFSTQSP